MNGNPELYLLLHREMIEEMERRNRRQQRIREAMRARAAERNKRPRFELRRLFFFL